MKPLRPEPKLVQDGAERTNVGSSCADKSTIYSKLQRDESHYPVRIACYVLAYFAFRSPAIQDKRMYD